MFRKKPDPDPDPPGLKGLPCGILGPEKIRLQKLKGRQCGAGQSCHWGPAPICCCQGHTPALSQHHHTQADLFSSSVWWGLEASRGADTQQCSGQWPQPQWSRPAAKIRGTLGPATQHRRLEVRGWLYHHSPSMEPHTHPTRPAKPRSWMP